ADFWATADRRWLRRGRPVHMLGNETCVIPLEELIWSKSYVMARERFDGADVAHLFLLQGHGIDWARLERLFGNHVELLLAHLILFRFLFPAQLHLVTNPFLSLLLPPPLT